MTLGSVCAKITVCIYRSEPFVVNSWLLDHLTCPRDHSSLEFYDGALACDQGHIYPVVSGIPILLVQEAEVTHDYIKRTFEAIEDPSLLVEKDTEPIPADEIDPFVQGEVPYTSGNLYFSVQHRLSRYPIPHLRLPPGNGARLLDISCNWGRWSIAAAQAGYRPIGLDPSLRAVLAARRVCKQIGVEADLVVGDARYLPFESDSFDTVFSYSVYQHLSKENARTSIAEASRVLRPGGNSLIQMPNLYGVHQFFNYSRRGFAEGTGFDVRYWTPSEILKVFNKEFGPTALTTDCYFGLGLQASDADLFPLRYRMLVSLSEKIRRLSMSVPLLAKAADSVYLHSTKSDI